MTISKWQVISFAAIHPVQILMGCVWLLTACKPNLLHIASCTAPYVYVINVANFLFSASKSITALLLLLLHGGRRDPPTKEIATLWRVNYCPAGASGSRERCCIRYQPRAHNLATNLPGNIKSPHHFAVRVCRALMLLRYTGSNSIWRCFKFNA